MVENERIRTMINTNKMMKFSIGMLTLGKTLKAIGGTTDNSPLFDNYEYDYPFRLPKLHNPVYGNTFKYHTSKGSSNMAKAYADRIRRTI
jgi:hypothetical protein